MQIFTAICDAFSHGANDVANAIGPFVTIYTIYDIIILTRTHFISYLIGKIFFRDIIMATVQQASAAFSNLQQTLTTFSKLHPWPRSACPTKGPIF